MSMRTLVRDFAGNMLHLARITHPAKRHAGQMLVATFHRVLPEIERKQYPYPGLAVTPEELRWFLSYFKQHYSCGHLAEIHRRHAAGEQPLKPFLAITFDDGQLDNYQHARPVLAELEINASFFIPVNNVDQSLAIWHDQLGFAVLHAVKTPARQQLLRHLLRDIDVTVSANRWIGTIAEAAKHMSPERRHTFVDEIDAIGNHAGIPEWAALMSWSQIEALSKAGHEIGSHSMTHALLPQCDDISLDFELVESKRILEQHINQAVESFCYPNGDHDTRTIEAVQRAGYRRAVTTHWGVNSINANAFSLKRCDMDALRVRTSTGCLSAALLALRLSGLHPKL